MLSYIRFKGEEALEPTDRIAIDTREVRGERASTLTFTDATVEDTCTLKVTAKNPAGEIDTSAKLNVQSKF